MPLESGTRLGPYEILALLGAGGMGEVYRSRDTRLDRLVAIKVLPAHLADRADLRERFEREARAVSSLNHPHICTLHDVGEQDSTYFLVMEYVEGETLADRLLRGPLPIDHALKYAIQISDALDKAHRQGVVHRDLKPGNIMLAKSGSKLLDFGLARLKQSGPMPAFTSASVLPTEKSGLTLQGTIIGTLQYMAPEQLEGKNLDARTDIFALGGVLYEMITGRKAFEGKSQVSLIGAILEREPTPISTLQPAAPAALDRVIRRSLAKDPDERWQTASDLTAQLRWISEAESRADAPAPVVVETPVRRSRAALSWIVAAVFFVSSVGLTVALFVTSRSASEAGVVRFSVSAPDKAVFENIVQNNIGATAGSVSPDGLKLAFTARDATGRVLLWLRPLDALTAQPLPGTEGAGWPFWSPDSRWIAFFAQGKLKKIDISGGPPQILCDAPNGRGGTWNQDGVIVFAPGNIQPLSRVSSAGGEAVVLTKLTPEQTNHRLPAFLPDGKHFIYWGTGIAPENSGVFVGTLDSTESHLLLRSDSAALYSPPGYLLFIRQGTLLAQPFDARKLQLSGDPVRVAEQVAFDGDSRGFDISENGLLVYRAGPSTGVSNVVLAWYDRAGKLIETLGTPGGYRGVELSPDGKRLAIHRHDGNGGDIWLMESAQGPMSRLTFGAAQDNSRPVWSPDGKRVAFGSLRNRKWGLYVKLADNTGNEELLVESDLPKMPASWSSDGKFLVYWVVDPKTGQDAWVLPLTGERKPFPILQTAATEFPAQISPDGKWIAYNSNETGSSQIHTRPFQSGDGNWQISTSGGSYPRWRGDSKELFYMGSGGKVIATEIRVAGTSIERGAPRELFDSGYFNLGHPTNYQAWVVSPDGQRFLIPRVEASIAGETAPLTVVLNWTTMLPQK